MIPAAAAAVKRQGCPESDLEASHVVQRKSSTIASSNCSDQHQAARTRSPRELFCKRAYSWIVCALSHLLTYFLCYQCAFYVTPELLEGSERSWRTIGFVVSVAVTGTATCAMWCILLLPAGGGKKQSREQWMGELGLQRTEDVPWCTICNEGKPSGMHHCSTCAQCVMNLDHHCIFINNCVGDRNATAFIMFLLTIAAATLYSAILAGMLVANRWEQSMMFVRKAYYMYREFRPERELSLAVKLVAALRALAAEFDCFIMIISMSSVGICCGALILCGCFLWNRRTEQTTLSRLSFVGGREKSG